jgi:hypothetical protein
MRFFNFLRLVLSCLIILASSANTARAIDEIEQYDLRLYSPVNYGLKDLVFEVRLSNLMDLLKEQMALDNLVDVYFKIYWMFPGQYQIEVEGLPRGFDALKSELRELIKDRLELMIPLSLSNKLRSYTLSYKAKKPNVIVEAIDGTNTRSINRIELEFENSGRLKSLTSFSPMGRTTARYAMSIKPWSHNKWAIDTLEVETTIGQQVNKTRNEISYVSVSGIGFPETVKIKNSTEIIAGSGKDADNPRVESESQIVFSKFEINTGRAQRHITQGR